MTTPPAPLHMPPNLLEHFYRGGAHIAALRGIEVASSHNPEEWLASTVHRWKLGPAGLSTTESGPLLRDVIAADPRGWLGCDRAGAGTDGDTGILVKLLDAGQRLPVHVHPDRPFARHHLRSAYGKTEAWHVLATEGDDPAVWVGFAEDVDPEEFAAHIDEQDSEWMIRRLNKISVRPGDSVLVPAGTAHAIGAGVFVMEIQEPTDYSVLLEWWVTTSGRDEAHLDLGFDTALRSVDHHALTGAALDRLRWRADSSATGCEPIRLLPPEADEFFRLDLLAPSASAPARIPAGFAVTVITDEAGVLVPADPARGDEIAVRRGDVLAIPAAFGDWSLRGPARALLCRSADQWPHLLRPPTGSEPGRR